MAHVFDYSGSGAGLVSFGGSTDFSFGYYFGGQSLPADYWTAAGALTGSLAWLEEDTSTFPATVVTVTGTWIADAFGQDELTYPGNVPGIYQTSATNADDAPPAYFAGAGRFATSTFIDGGMFGSALWMSGIDAVARTMGPLAAVYSDFGTAGWAVRDAATAANAAFDADVAALGSVRLSEAGVITVLSWSDLGAGADDFVLRLTPDAESDRRLSDLLDLEQPDAPPGYVAARAFDSFVAGEDVVMIMTGQGDVLDFGAFAARSLTVDLGAGDDSFAINGEGEGQAFIDSLPDTLSLMGGAGDDVMSVFTTAVLAVDGGEGNDFIVLTAGGLGLPSVFTVAGGAGNDTIYGEARGGLFAGDAGDDSLFGSYDTDTIEGGSGDDWLTDGAIWKDFAQRDFGTANTMSGGAGSDSVWGGAGDDELSGGAGRDALWGLRGDDIMRGGGATDSYLWEQYYAGQDRALGDDTIIDRGGLIVVGSGAPVDTLLRLGNDLLIGDAGVSSLRIVDYYDNARKWSGALDRGLGPVADDRVIDFATARRLEQVVDMGEAGEDTLRLREAGVAAGAGGNDALTGSRGDDILFGDDGADVLKGRGGSDRLVGGEGGDTLRGGGAGDILAGNAGNDRLVGNGGEDALYGGSGDDRLFGGGGADRLTGGAGDDVLKGGKGADVFEFVSGFGIERIADLDRREGDRIAISRDMFLELPNPSNVTPESLVALFGSVVDGAVVLDFRYGDVIVIEGTTNLAQVAASIDILF